MYAAPAWAGTFTVDEPDDALSDGSCTTGACTCRDAFDAANASAGDDTIELGVDCILTNVGIDDTNANGDLDAWDDNAGTTLTILSVGGTTRTMGWSGATADGDRDRVIHTHDLVSGEYAVNLDITDVVITEGYVDGGGSALGEGGGCVGVADADVTLNDVRMTVCRIISSGATPLNHGGALYVDGDVTILDSQFDQSTATNGHGGAVWASGDLTIGTGGGSPVDGAVFDGNSTSTSGSGGQIYVSGQTSVVAITRSTLEGGYSADDGGGGWFNVSELTITDTEIYGSDAENNGGALYVTVPSSQGTSRVLERSLLYDNAADLDGGGLYLESAETTATVYVENSTFSNNTAGSDGGATYIEGPASGSNVTTLRLESCTEYENGATASTSSATYEEANTSFTYRDSIIHGECAPASGGAAGTSLGGNSVETPKTSACDSDGTIDQLVGSVSLGSLGAGSGGLTRYHIPAGGFAGVNFIATCNATEDQRGAARPASPGTNCDSGAFEQ